MSSGVVQMLLVAAVVVLAIAAGLLLGLALRRRARPPAPGEARGPLASSSGRPLASRPITTLSSPPPVPGASGARARSNPGIAGATSASGGASSPGGAASAAGGGMAGAIAVGASDRACPSCKTVYQDMIYCQKDARRLVPVEELAAATGRTGGLACPRCGRGFEHGLRRCPHDGGELVPLAMYQATRRRRDSGPTGVLAKVCPVCRRRFDLSSRFCGRDGHELVVVN